MTDLYENIGKRTDGDIYIGVVGPVRSGKSTFIKKFMECLVIPNISDAAKRTQAIDELPQSAAGRTVMTTQPNFIPQQRAHITIGSKQNLRVRLVDCVGYMIKGAQGDTEEGKPRMVKTPWFKQAVPFEKAARVGTEKVITDHSTIGIVVTTDGSVTDIPRENYLEAEEKAIQQLKKLGKPFVVVLNSVTPRSQNVSDIVDSICHKFNVPVIRANCLDLDKGKIEEILSLVLTQFDVKEIKFTVPKWLAMQGQDFPPKAKITENIIKNFEKVKKVSDVSAAAELFSRSDHILSAGCGKIDYSTGCVTVNTTVDKDLYYDTLQSITGTDVKDDWALMQLMQSLMHAKNRYDRLAPALQQVETNGYGIVMPTLDQLQLEEPEMFKQGTKFGIRFSASAPSLHIIKADISTTVSPILGNDSSGEDLVQSLLANYENNSLEIWQSNLLGNSPQELVNRGLNAKLANLPSEAREKLASTIERVVNEGCQGLICIIL
ncbi:MAG: stage IV sporulation protein A [Oscillospiraceae bacterium]|nr:stage IV sporulation protein A [Oscillospiraceae bacterium]MBQ6850198.1 stage IV sporulation protein A [Oscillospiraceae bacterium]